VPVADTIPYPWPFDGEPGLAPARCALVLVGLQEHWRRLDDTDAISRAVVLADTLRARGVLVVWVRSARDGHARRPATDLPVLDSAGAAFVVEPGAEDLVIATGTHDAFLDTSLHTWLRALGRDHLVFAGLAAETVLDSTLRSANDRGYECLTLHDLAVPFDPGTGRRALHSITMSGGIFGAVGSTTDLVAALCDPLQEETAP
jgi:nicotinamidase-related amidase